MVSHYIITSSSIWNANFLSFWQVSFSILIISHSILPLTHCAAGAAKKQVLAARQTSRQKLRNVLRRRPQQAYEVGNFKT